jgi:hypothetical protein
MKNAGVFKGAAKRNHVALQPSASMLRAFGRGALHFAYIRVRLVCVDKTMHRMVLSLWRRGYGYQQCFTQPSMAAGARGKAFPLWDIDF